MREDEAGENSEEETNTREARIRVALDNFMNGETYGANIERFIGILSIISCCTFLWLSYTDWSTETECCLLFHKALSAHKEEKGDNIVYPIKLEGIADCDPKCNEYYYSRMPVLFEYIDKGICLIYLVNYVIVIYISQNRCQYFISNASIVELFIIIPVVLLPYNCDYYGVLLKAASRMLRIFKVEIFIKKTSDGDETNVSQLIYNTITDLLLKLFITAALFMVIEN